ncbi:MAG: phage protein Gp36 family protein [Phycisphaerae bacterium]
MSYITNSDIQERLGAAAYVQLTDDDGNGVADTGVVDEARLGAEGEVNSHLARRFRVPIDVTVHPELADLLATVTLDLAEHRLRQRRPPVAKDALRRHERALTWLHHVAGGLIELPAAVAPADTTSRGTLGKATGEQRLLTRDELAGH